jgi:DNA-binding response OmpR family regulator
VPKILLVEDDKDLSLTISTWLSAQNFSVDTAYDGASGYEYLKRGRYEVVILDWNLPGMTGVELAKRFRFDGGTTPILMLTGKGSIEEKEQGLDSGADDYLTKPFAMRELSARLRALARRAHSPVSGTLKAGSIELDPDKRLVLKHGVPVHVVPKDFSVLEFLMRYPGEVFSAETLLQRVWSFDSEASTDAVRTSIKRIRRAIDDEAESENSCIENVRTLGYRFRILPQK